MATITQPHRCKDWAGIRARRVVRVTGPSSYTAGGDPVTANQFGLGLIEYFPDSLAMNSSLTMRLVHYDPANGTLVWVVPNTGSEVAGGTDLSGFTFDVEVIGKG